MQHTLANVGLDSFWVIEYAPQESACFIFNQMVKLLYCAIVANFLCDPLPVVSEPIVVVGKHHGLPPPRKFTTHNRSRAVGIVCTTFLEELLGNLS